MFFASLLYFCLLVQFLFGLLCFLSPLPVVRLRTPAYQMWQGKGCVIRAVAQLCRYRGVRGRIAICRRCRISSDNHRLLQYSYPCRRCARVGPHYSKCGSRNFRYNCTGGRWPSSLARLITRLTVSGDGTRNRVYGDLRRVLYDIS